MILYFRFGMDSNTSDNVEMSSLSINQNTSFHTTIQATSMYFLLLTITNGLDMFMVPILITIGVIGNTLSFVTFIFSNLKSLSSSVYLAALAIADIGFLLCVLASWITNFNVNLYHQPGWCQTFVYLTYVFSFLSVWYVVGFTVERYIAVRFPFKRGDMCTVRRARIVVVSLALFAIVAYNFAIWTSGSFLMPSSSPIAGQRLCYPIDPWRNFLKFSSNIDSIITLLIPFIAIAFLNVNIIYVITHYRHQANHFMLHRVRSSNAQTQSTTLANSTNVKVTRMLLAVSFTFLILNVPGHFIRIYVFVQSFNDPYYRPSVLYYEFQRLWLYFSYMNYSVNFFLYSLCGKNFRMGLKSLLGQLRHKRAISTSRLTFRWSTRGTYSRESTKVNTVRTETIELQTEPTCQPET